MYGGTSLAIYINGVAQELLALVRATAPETTESGAKVAHIPTKELRGAEHVYRELGQMVGWDGVRPDRHGSGHPIRTRFVATSSPARPPAASTRSSSARRLRTSRT